MTNRIYQLYLELLKKYGSPEKFWPQWCAKRKSLAIREKIAIGAILTQRTSWHNAHLSLVNLKRAGIFSLRDITKVDIEKLRELVKPAGFFQTKPHRLKNFALFIIKNYGSLKNFMKEEYRVARQKLLTLKGIGPETADTILLYALGKPTFVIDEYTKRLVRKRKLADCFDYDFLKNFFEKNLPRYVKLYQDLHALIIIDQKGELGSVMKKV